MDQAALVMDEIDAGGAFVKAMAEQASVAGAAWIRPAEDGERYLYVVIADLTDERRRETYRQVRQAANAIADRHYIDRFRVRLVGPEEPVAKAIADVNRRYPVPPTPTRFDGKVFAGQAVAEVYIYAQNALKAQP